MALLRLANLRAATRRARRLRIFSSIVIATFWVLMCASSMTFYHTGAPDATVSPASLPNGLELSGPAKAPSDYRAELAGSAPAICYAYPMHERLTEADGSEEKVAATAATGRRRHPTRAGFDSPLPSLGQPPEVIGRRPAGPCRQEVFHR